MALKGHGATVRYVTLPNEAHGYAARETLLHVIAERLNWFDKYVKNAGGARRRPTRSAIGSPRNHEGTKTRRMRTPAFSCFVSSCFRG